MAAASPVEYAEWGVFPHPGIAPEMQPKASKISTERIMNAPRPLIKASASGSQAWVRSVHWSSLKAGLPNFSKKTSRFASFRLASKLTAAES